MKKIPISVTMMVKDGERYLNQCLQALQDFDEIVILDNGSTDNSIAIAESFPNVTLYKADFFGFGPMKNDMAEKAKHDWILNVDCDEIFNPELVEEIRQLDLEQVHKAYAISRINHYRGKPIKTCGWYPDYVKRLYNRNEVHFNDKQVHESLDIPKKVKLIRLKGSFNHYSFEGAAGLINKMQKYTTLFAEQQRGRKRASLGGAIGHGLSAFIKSYIFRRGFMDGADGFVISMGNGTGAYYKYVKLYEANESITTSLIITTYNRPDALRLVLNSVLNQTVLPNEVIVADDGSNQETAELIKEYQTKFPVPLIHSWQEDKGFRLARSRNLAISKSTMEYIVMIDGDMVLDKHFIADHKKAAKHKTFIQGGRILLNDDKTAKLLESTAQKVSLSCLSSGLESRIEKRLQAIHMPFLRNLLLKKEKSHWHKGIRGANMGFFREDVMEINGFNNEFEGWGREDSEFVERFFNAGGKRANLKFGGIGYHLWHPEAEREALPENEALLKRATKEKLNWCEDGLNQFQAEKV